MIKINCDLCGKTENSLFRSVIEGVELNVCSTCSKFGKVIGQVRKPIIKIKESRPKKIEQEEKTEVIVKNYPEIIKRKRESMGLSQKDFAKKINEKESIVHHIETGKFEPSLDLAKKLEKMLGIKLIEELDEDIELPKRKEDEGFTLGDFIKLK